MHNRGAYPLFRPGEMDRVGAHIPNLVSLISFTYYGVWISRLGPDPITYSFMAACRAAR